MVDSLLIYLEKNVKSMASFRANFIIGTLSMTISNFIFMGTLLYLFYTLGTIGNLTFELLYVSFCIFNLTFVLSINFFTGMTKLPSLIINGDLDRVLIRPISLYKHILMYRLNPYGLAEIITATIFFAFLPLHWWPFAILMALVSSVILHCMVFIFNLIPLFIDMNESVNFIELFITSAQYPPDMFIQGIKFITLFIIPGGLITFGGVMALYEPYLWVALLSYAIGSIIVLWLMLHFGLKKYRSAGY